MTRDAGRSPSIRRRLLLFLLPPLIALMLISVYANYRAAMVFMRAANDERLADLAIALAAEVKANGMEVRFPSGSQPTARPGALSYSILGPDGRQLGGNTPLPVVPPGKSNPTFADVQSGSTPLRVATYRLRTSAGPVTVSVAQVNDPGTGSAHYILASAWLIDFIQLDVILIIVWIGVHFGLKPLLAVRRQIEAHETRELKPLELHDVPAEVRPLVDALNLLFDMLREAAASQRRFVADTAHQLRTPIAGLLGQLELLMREPQAAPLAERLAALHDGTTRLAHSANQLLTLARADPSATLSDQFEKLDLKVLVERIVEANVDRATRAGLDLGAEASSAHVTGSARLLEDLLGNLVDNALKYTPSGGHVTVRCGASSQGAYLEVEDDGPGIPQAERAQVRQRFYRSAGVSADGTGLGLAIVDEIAAQHGAILAIDSGPGGRGTRMRVNFETSVTARRRAERVGTANPV